MSAHETFIEWANALLGVPVIKSHQSADRPTSSYVSVEVLRVDDLEEHPQRFSVLSDDPLEGVEALPVLEQEWTLLVIAYRDGARGLLQRIKSAAHFSQVQEPMFPTYVIHEVSGINTLPEMVDSRWETRYQLNVMLRGMVDQSHVTDTIEQHEPYVIERI